MMATSVEHCHFLHHNNVHEMMATSVEHCQFLHHNNAPAHSPSVWTFFIKNKTPAVPKKTLQPCCISSRTLCDPKTGGYFEKMLI
jgi:hypothetical protein